MRQLSPSDNSRPCSVLYLLVGEYRRYCRILRCLNDMFSGCVDDNERRAWQQRASEELQKAQRIRCRRATPGDNQRFHNACETLRTTLCRFTGDTGPWLTAFPAING